MPTAYIYIRCSHEDSTESGYGLMAQEEISRRYYDLMRVSDPRLKGVALRNPPFVDASVSAYKPQTADFAKRPAGRELIAALQPGDQIIFARLDRSFRNVRECLKWIDRWESEGVGIHFADMKIDTGTAMGRFMLQVMAAIAEWQSGYISERTKEGQRAYRMRNGREKIPARWQKIREGGRVVGYRIPRDLLLAMRFFMWQRKTLGKSYRESRRAWEICICRRDRDRHPTKEYDPKLESRWQFPSTSLTGELNILERLARALWPLRYPGPLQSTTEVPHWFRIEAYDDGKMWEQSSSQGRRGVAVKRFNKSRRAANAK